MRAVVCEAEKGDESLHSQNGDLSSFRDVRKSSGRVCIPGLYLRFGQPDSLLKPESHRFRTQVQVVTELAALFRPPPPASGDREWMSKLIAIASERRKGLRQQLSMENAGNAHEAFAKGVSVSVYSFRRLRSKAAAERGARVYRGDRPNQHLAA